MVSVQKASTIQDVARHANVSAATVSRALSNPDRVSKGTRDKVAEAVRVTGYTVNQMARSLRLRAARTLLIALPNIGNPFYSTILDAVVHEAESRGYGVLVASHREGDDGSRLSEYFFSNRADGLLLFDGAIDPRRLTGLPSYGGRQPIIVSYDEIPDPAANAVLTDNRAAAGRAVRYLYELGHRRIGHLAGHSRNAQPNERLLGFREALSALGLTREEPWIVQGDYTTRGGVAAGERFLALKNRPSAVFAGNDEMALGFIHAISQGGLTCPGDVSVIGFDDIAIAQHYAPPLTTMRQPREEMGGRATAALIDILEGAAPAPGAIRIVLNSELVVRASTASVPSASPAR